MEASRQPNLFGGAPASPASTDARGRRVQLDATSWLELIPGWLAGADALFACLLEALPWQQLERPRFERMVLTAARSGHRVLRSERAGGRG